MFETILSEVPELRRIEGHLTELQEQRTQAYGKAVNLAQKVEAAHEGDLTASASALNRGRERPRPRAPKLQEQLEGAQAELLLLDRRIELLSAERGEFVRDHKRELLSLLQQQHTDSSNTVAELASHTLEALLLMYRAEDEARQLQRTYPDPPAEPSEAPQQGVDLTTIYPLQTVANTLGPKRGDLESALRVLQSYGEATVIGDGDDADSDNQPAAILHEPGAGHDARNGTEAVGGGG